MPVLEGWRGNGIGEPSRMVELRTACHQDLEDVFPIVLHPANQSMLEVRVPHVRVALWKGEREKGEGRGGEGEGRAGGEVEGRREGEGRRRREGEGERGEGGGGVKERTRVDKMPLSPITSPYT